MNHTEDFLKFRENSPAHNSDLTVFEMIKSLEDRVLSYNLKNNTSAPEKYRDVHLPEIKRQSSIIESVIVAFNEFKKTP